jgi:hypothetical protein
VPGAIVLLHDGSQRTPDQGLATARAVAATLPLLGEMHLEPVTVSEGATIAERAPAGPSSRKV